MEQRSITKHYAARAVIMACMSIFITYLVATDRMVYYIAPRMELYVKLTALALFISAVSQVYLALRAADEPVDACNCEQLPPRSIWMNSAIYLLFALPIILGVAMPDQVMGSSVAELKGMNLQTSAAVKTSSKISITESQATLQDAADQGDGSWEAPAMEAAEIAAAESANGTDTAMNDEELRKLFPSDEFTEQFVPLAIKLYKKQAIPIKEEGFMELLTTIDLYIDRFVGKTMEISGFVYRLPDMQPNQFVVSRLAMQCCSADAAPYGVLVESDLAQGLEKDAWVSVTGVINQTVYNDNKIMVLTSPTIVKTTASKTPYVYPYFEDFNKLAD